MSGVCQPGLPWRRDSLPTPVFLDFVGGLAGKDSACNVGDWGLNSMDCNVRNLENSMECISMGSQKVRDD